MGRDMGSSALAQSWGEQRSLKLFVKSAFPSTRGLSLDTLTHATVFGSGMYSKGTYRLLFDFKTDLLRPHACSAGPRLCTTGSSLRRSSLKTISSHRALRHCDQICDFPRQKKLKAWVLLISLTLETNKIAQISIFYHDNYKLKDILKQLWWVGGNCDNL